MRARRAAFLLLALLAAAGMVFEDHRATDFPTDAPVRRVDAAVVARLRATPGLHVALARDYVLEVPLDLRDDAFNRRWYATDLDLREAVPERAIHIQRRKDDGRAAIHADAHNPKTGAWPFFVHATLDVPMLPLLAALAIGVAGALRRRRVPATSDDREL